VDAKPLRCGVGIGRRSQHVIDAQQQAADDLAVGGSDRASLAVEDRQPRRVEQLLVVYEDVPPAGRSGSRSPGCSLVEIKRIDALADTFGERLDLAHRVTGAGSESDRLSHHCCCLCPSDAATANSSSTDALSPAFAAAESVSARNYSVCSSSTNSCPMFGPRLAQSQLPAADTHGSLVSLNRRLHGG
jgi:hypothetical protein